MASVVTYSPADPAASQAPCIAEIYQPDQLVYPANATIQNAGGRLGAWTADLLINVLGVGVYFLIVGLIALEIALFRRSPVESPWLKTIGWATVLLGLTSLSCMLLPDWTIGAGGYVGALISGLMTTNIGTTGAIAAGISMVIGGMMMWTEYLIFRAGRLAFAPALVAATAILPFGLVHGFVQWFNGEVEEEEDDEEEVEYEDEDDEYETEEDSKEEDEEDDYEPMANASLNIRDNTSKTIVPALMPASDALESEISDELTLSLARQFLCRSSAVQLLDTEPALAEPAPACAEDAACEIRQCDESWGCLCRRSREKPHPFHTVA